MTVTPANFSACNIETGTPIKHDRSNTLDNHFFTFTFIFNYFVISDLASFMLARLLISFFDRQNISRKTNRSSAISGNLWFILLTRYYSSIRFPRPALVSVAESRREAFCSHARCAEALSSPWHRQGAFRPPHRHSIQPDADGNNRL